MRDIKNVLADRYASNEMRSIWSEDGKVLFEREFWISVLKAQRKLGIDVPDVAISAYEKVKNNINLESIRKRELKLRHDVKARIEEFCDLAGYQHIHKGLTSRDLTDNVEQYQVIKALKLVHQKTVSTLNILAKRAEENKDLIITGRTHNVAAQPTTLGKRMAMFGEELLQAYNSLTYFIDNYPLRGVKGAIGTLLDQKTLFGNDAKKLNDFQNLTAECLGFKKVLNAVGQVYPRSLDFKVVSLLYNLSCGPSSFCKTLRLMAGHELISEGFQKGQVGSSAMPHKMNSRNCERVNGFHVILNGHVTMAAGLAGDQWNEGDVSCSVVRRVVLPDSFFAIDGLLETFMTILTEMKVYNEIVEKETRYYLPFLITTTILMEAVKKGKGREELHEIIKKHSHEVIEDLRSNKISENDLIKRLGKDESFPLSEKELNSILQNSGEYLGDALMQTKIFVHEVKEIADKYPEAVKITPKALI